MGFARRSDDWVLTGAVRGCVRVAMENATDRGGDGEGSGGPVLETKGDRLARRCDFVRRPACLPS